MKKNVLTIIFFIGISIPLLIPFFQKGFFVTDDADWMIVRSSAFHQTLKDGQFPVRFLGRLNNDYGYPVATFLYPGFMYAIEPIHLIGFDFVTSIKIIFILSLISSSIFCYFWLRTFFDTFESGIGAIVYLYTPYHVYDVYQRGSLGEVLAMAILPFILWQIERKSIFLATLGIGLLLISHNTLAALFLFFILCYMGITFTLAKNKKQYLFYCAKILFLGIGLSAFFWMPILAELQYTVFNQTKISDWSTYFASIPLVGYATIIIFLFSFFLFITKKIAKKNYFLTLLFFITGTIFLFLSTEISTFIWEILPGQFIQFPFRCLSLVLICSAFLTATILSFFKKRQKIIVGSILLLILFFSTFPFSQKIQYTQKDETYYTTNMGTTTTHDEYMPRWVKEKPTQKAEQKVVIKKGKGEIKDIIATNKKISFTINANDTLTIQINTIYWPGWEALIDEKIIPISYTNPQGVMQVTLPKGNHAVTIRFSETPLRLFSDAVSLISFFVLIILTWNYPLTKKQR